MTEELCILFFAAIAFIVSLEFAIRMMTTEKSRFEDNDKLRRYTKRLSITMFALNMAFFTTPFFSELFLAIGLSYLMIIILIIACINLGVCIAVGIPINVLSIYLSIRYIRQIGKMGILYIVFSSISMLLSLSLLIRVLPVLI